MRWQDVDLSAGTVRVQWQVDRKGELVELKTDKARRTVYLKGEPAKLARILREHKAASPYSQEGHFVFSSLTGTRILETTFRRALNRPIKKALSRT